MYQQKIDILAKKTYLALESDFARFHGHRVHQNVSSLSIQESRAKEWPRLGLVDPHYFKCRYQLKNLFKRFRFQHDLYTDEELTAMSHNKYVSFQVGIRPYQPLSASTFLVLRTARRLCRELLGKFSLDDLCNHVKVGRRATIGNPLSRAYLDNKFGDPVAFTCPSTLRRWFFDDYLPGDAHLKSIVKDVFNKKREGRPDLQCDSLKLVLVPKSWKTHRAITPLSNIGLFYSYGYGALVEDALARAGLRLSHLQEKHRRLARNYSVSRSHVTADLSSASDSLSSVLLNRLLPREWYNALKKCFVRTIHVGDSVIYTESILPMGNGATFPIETLVFYSLIKAVGLLTKTRGTYSVYGDDCIYPRRIHNYVVKLFNNIGVHINEDKTFVDSWFRESCGGDFYRGVDVRPVLFPERPDGILVGKRWTQFLYKLWNAFERRWSKEEIPSLFHLLSVEIANSSPVVHQVPQHFPDTSGIKVDQPYPVGLFPWSPVKTFFSDGSKHVSFKFLGITTPKKRPVERELIYMWDSLRALTRRKGCATSVGSTLSRFSWKNVPGVAYLPDKNFERCELQVCVLESWTQGKQSQI